MEPNQSHHLNATLQGHNIGGHSNEKVLETKKRRRLQEARDLISNLHYEEEIQALKRRWLMRRWPEYQENLCSNSKNPSKSGFLMDRYIPESLLRNDNCLQKIKDTVRKPINVRLPCSASLTEMPLSWIDTAKSTLNQLEKFPIHTLHVMRRKLKGKPLGSKAEGVKRSSLANRVKKLGEKLLLNAQECDPIPGPLKKALLVASLSARKIFGEDGGLLQRLGPISPETNALGNKFLKAISHVQKLQHVELKDVCSCLYPDTCFSSIGRRVLQQKIQMVLVDSLLESCDTTIPEPVMRCMIMINRLGAGKEDAKRKRNLNRYKTEPRVEVESECVLNVSSHLQQIIYNWTEQAGLHQGLTELHLDESEETCEQWFSEDSYNSFALAGDGEDYVELFTWDSELVEDEEPSLKEHEKEMFEGGEFKSTSQEDMLRKNSCHVEEREIDCLQQIQEISDEAGLLAYHIIGCMMDEFLIRQGEKKPCTCQEDMDTSMLLNIAAKLLPQMPGSVIESVKLSLGPL